MRKEINIPLDLNETQARLLDRHSLLNLLNILHLEIENLIEKSEFEPLVPYRFIMVDIIQALSESEIEQKLTSFMHHIKDLVPILEQLEHVQPHFKRSVKSILVIIEVAIVRVEEFQSRRLEWQYIPAEWFRRKLLQFFDATELVSRKRFHFIYPPSSPKKDGYLIDINLDLQQNTDVFAPPVIHDLIRDLSANARKYSPPGTRIGIDIRQDTDQSLFIRISDEGIGIPEPEIDNVVRFSSRGSNASYKPTMGNGFGLTKAYQITKLFNGTFIIESEINRGTTIELSLFPAA